MPSSVDRSNPNYSPVFKQTYGPLGDNVYGTYDRFRATLTHKYGALGLGKKFPLQTTFGGGVGGGGTGGNVYPTANIVKFLNPELVDHKRTYATFEFDRYSVVQSKGSAAAFINTIDHGVKAKLKAFNRMHACIDQNDGTGILGQFVGPATLISPGLWEVIILDRPTDGVTETATTSRYGRRRAHWEIGENIQIGTAANLAVSSFPDVYQVMSTENIKSTGAIRISKLVDAGGDPATFAAVKHNIYFEGLRNSAPLGTLTLNDASAVFYGVAQQERWKPLRKNYANIPFQSDMLTDMVTEMADLTDECPTDIEMSVPLYNYYLKILEDQGNKPKVCCLTKTSDGKPDPKRYKTGTVSPSVLNAHVGWNAIQFHHSAGTLMLTSNRFLRDDMVLLLNKRADRLVIDAAQKPKWEDEDGVVYRQITGKAVFQANYFFYHEMVFNPFYQGVISGVNAPATV
jgi:hypothetical protein